MLAVDRHPKTLLFALFNGIVEFEGCPLLSEGEQARRSADAHERMRRSSSLEKKYLRQSARGEQVEEKALGIHEKGEV